MDTAEATHATPEKIAIIGLGYVGLPLALAFAKHYDVIGIDTDAARVDEIRNNADRTEQASRAELAAASRRFACYPDIAMAKDCTVYIITAPTPVDLNHEPDLTAIIAASEAVGKIIKQGDLVVYESTVCPGTTEDICIPILSAQSNLKINDDFVCGYSPERISPHDKNLSDIVKVIAASSASALDRVANLYGKIITAGVYRAPSIRVAEAAKITENIQRDVDIAITNELAMVYNQMGISSEAVFDAAATKWNFRRFTPGFVGGHCIGTDSYYLLDHADKKSYPMYVLKAARYVNNQVPMFVAQKVISDLQNAGRDPTAASVLVMGFTFKENCPDVRHTLVARLRAALYAAGCRVRICDPVADCAKAKEEYGINIETNIERALAQPADAVVFAVAHSDFAKIPKASLANHRIYDIKNIAPHANWYL